MMVSEPDTVPTDTDPLKQESAVDFLEQALDPRACFLCGVAVDDDSRTREHVFPKWLIKRHDLWNAQIALLNGTLIPYSQLTVTCCKTCNGTHLSKLEMEISDAFAGGPDAVRALPEERLFLWLGKFYYGLVFRQLSLKANRHLKDIATIVSEEHLRMYALHHVLLRRILGKVEWNEFPGSIFVFDALDTDNRELSFDYFDALDGPFVCLKSGATLVIAFLQDFGAVFNLNLEASPQVAAARSVKLHPLQCVELIAFFYTILKLRDRVPKFIIGKQEPGFNVLVMPQGGVSGRSPFASWDEDLYRQVLDAFFKERFGLDLFGGSEPAQSAHTPSLLVGSNGRSVQAPSADWRPEVWDAPEVLALS